jgi:hypothetical protein
VASTVSAPQATLPFTGMDVRPLVIAGSSLIVMGLGLLATLERRRRAMWALGSCSTRTARWLLGD